VLRRYVQRGAVTAERASEALQSFVALDLERYDHVPLLPRIWALRDNHTAYDAAYIALAEALHAPLLTADERLAQAPGRAVVQLLRA
jgi:predicted nucleic acid-binding protein